MKGFLVANLSRGGQKVLRSAVVYTDRPSGKPDRLSGRPDKQVDPAAAGRPGSEGGRGIGKMGILDTFSKTRQARR